VYWIDRIDRSIDTGIFLVRRRELRALLAEFAIVATDRDFLVDFSI
jgi:hypothetical protein